MRISFFNPLGHQSKYSLNLFQQTKEKGDLCGYNASIQKQNKQIVEIFKLNI